ncbi:hypothetical protein [Marinoscillum sp.]|uniref:hypothetical protein n=1 Tax=Marinoscillum sp. TaxID=2024838 RepID=UPI003BAAA635
MRTTIIFSLALACSFVSTGQSTALQSLTADYQRNRELTISYLEAMPAEQYNFKAADGTRTFAEQMLHAAQGMIGLSANGTGADRIYPGKNLEKDPDLQSKAEVTRIVTEAYIMP